MFLSSQPVSEICLFASSDVRFSGRLSSLLRLFSILFLEIDKSFTYRWVKLVSLLVPGIYECSAKEQSLQLVPGTTPTVSLNTTFLFFFSWLTSVECLLVPRQLKLTGPDPPMMCCHFPQSQLLT